MRYVVIGGVDVLETVDVSVGDYLKIIKVGRGLSTTPEAVAPGEWSQYTRQTKVSRNSRFYSKHETMYSLRL